MQRSREIHRQQGDRIGRLFAVMGDSSVGAKFGKNGTSRRNICATSCETPKSYLFSCQKYWSGRNLDDFEGVWAIFSRCHPVTLTARLRARLEHGGNFGATLEPEKRQCDQNAISKKAPKNFSKNFFQRIMYNAPVLSIRCYYFMLS
jgi:hypothetical protein